MTGALAAEWTKLWTVRATWGALAAAVPLSMLNPLITGMTTRSQHDAGVADPFAVDPAVSAASGMLTLGQLPLVTLATLVIAGEYATGSMRTTLQCVPGRYRMLGAKALVLMPVLALAGAVLTVAGAFVGATAAGVAGPSLAVGMLLRSAGGAAVYLALLGPLVVGLGAMLRSVAGTLAVVLALVLLVPMLLDQSGIEALQTVGAGFPGSAGRVLVDDAGSGQYGPGTALAVLVTWAVVAQAAAGALLRVRDG